MCSQFPGVLVCDESELIRSLVCELLQDDDFVVVAEAADVDEALDRMVSVRADVVVLDLGTPATPGLIPGLAAVRRIRSSWPDAAIAVHARASAGEAEALALEHGADAYVEQSSPFELPSGIRSALSRRAALDAATA